jgi:hypothetical protein
MGKKGARITGVHFIGAPRQGRVDRLPITRVINKIDFHPMIKAFVSMFQSKNRFHSLFTPDSNGRAGGRGWGGTARVGVELVAAVWGRAVLG